MSSLLQGGRRKRRAGARLARLLLILAPIAVVVAIVFAQHHHSSARAPARNPQAGQQTPGATPSRGPAAPAPERAARAGVDPSPRRLKAPPRAGMVFDVTTGEVL